MAAYSTALTCREWEVLELIAQGLTHWDVAARLCISHYTVGNHTSNIEQKLAARNAAHAVFIAFVQKDSAATG